MGAAATKAKRWTGDWTVLVDEVVQSGRCTGCAGCVVACPHELLQLDESTWRPFLLPDGAVDGDTSRCARGERGCTLCTRACARFRDWERDADHHLHGRSRTTDEVAGIYRGIYLVAATDTELAAAGQDGGFATALLEYALLHDYIDCAIVSYFDETWGTRPGVATTREELLRAAGSRYTYSANTLALQEAESRGLSRLALVGMGCQTTVPAVAAARGARRMSRRIALTVGLMCTKTFGEDIYEDLFRDRYGVSRSEITKINIKGRVQLWLDRDPSDDYLEIPLKEAREWTRPGCLRCPDFGAAHADVSLGGIGAYPGRTLAVVRSDLGMELLTAMREDGWILVDDALEKDPGAVELMYKLAARQRRRWN